MNIMFILIGASLLLAGSFLLAFFWASKKGQFDDTFTPAVRILFDEKLGTPNMNNKNNREK